MIKENIKKWHDLIKGDYSGGFDELLDDDVSFYSPIVFSPQRGKELTTLYLMAAGNTFGGDQSKDGTLEESSFKYTKEVLDGNHAVLEFETQIDGKYVNGVDIITFNDEGKIIEFKVMIRPLQALQILQDNNCNIEIINYLETDLDVSLIKDVLKKLSLKPRDILRTSEQEYKDNNLKEDLSDDDLIDYMVKYPKLIERPIVIKEHTAVLGRPPENVLELL
jgi:arsenate reductase (glutaredoxin)